MKTCYFCQKELRYGGRSIWICVQHQLSIHHHYSSMGPLMQVRFEFRQPTDPINFSFVIFCKTFYNEKKDQLRISCEKPRTPNGSFLTLLTVYEGKVLSDFSPENAVNIAQRMSNLKAFL